MTRQPRADPDLRIAGLNFNQVSINAALADSKIKARLADLGGNVLSGTPAEYGKLIVDETEKWGKVIKFAGVKPN